MPDNFLLIVLLAYFVLISLVAIVMTFRDKHTAEKGKWRIKESTLLLVAALGGSITMLLTMRGIRHKTKHAKFMVGIPVIIVLQLALAFFIWWQFF